MNLAGKYYHTKESVKEYIRMAEGHDGSAIIQQLHQFLPEKAKVLELGSGPGKDWELLNQSYRVVGSDNSKAFLDHLRISHPEGEFLQLDASTIDTELLFDAIYSNKVLHHLEDNQLISSIQRQHQILHPEGIVCHTFWKGEDSEIYNDLFVNYHLDTGIRELFDPYFQVLLIQHYQEFDKSDSILYIGKKK